MSGGKGIKNTDGVPSVAAGAEGSAWGAGFVIDGDPGYAEAHLSGAKKVELVRPGDPGYDEAISRIAMKGGLPEKAEDRKPPAAAGRPSGLFGDYKVDRGLGG